MIWKAVLQQTKRIEITNPLLVVRISLRRMLFFRPWLRHRSDVFSWSVLLVNGVNLFLLRRLCQLSDWPVLNSVISIFIQERVRIHIKTMYLTLVILPNLTASVSCSFFDIPLAFYCLLLEYIVLDVSFYV